MGLLFFPLQKVDLVKREVWGVAAEERPDKGGEVMDYALSKPHFESWSADISKASGGKSLGNVRVMHGFKAAGKVIDMQFDDVSKAVRVGVKVVDDDEWRKVQEGVYTGFSLGGSYGKRWPDPSDPQLMRYEAIPAEISLVDNPAMYGATFTVVKSDGAEELRKFTGDTQGELPVTRVELAKFMVDLVSEHTLSKRLASYVTQEALEKALEGVLRKGVLEGFVTAESLTTALAKVAEQEFIKTLQMALADAQAKIVELQKAMETFQAQPAAGAPVMRMVNRGDGEQPVQRTVSQDEIDDLRRAVAVEPNPMLKAAYQQQLNALLSV